MMKKRIKDILKITVLYPLVLLNRTYENYLMNHNPVKLMKIRYKKNMGINLDLSNPRNLDEKINYMSFFTDTSMWSDLADKIKVREYVIRCGFPEILNELYGVYDTPEEINFKNLPDRFVLKTNHASATNFFVYDKARVDLVDLRNKFNKWLKIDYGLKTATPHYSRIKPKIIAEKYLLQNNDIKLALTDYKIYCFNGVPRYIFVFSDRIANTHQYSKMIYDCAWNPHPEFINNGLKMADVMCRPESLDKMLNIARILSNPFPFVRVDLYEIEGEPIFSELTFTPGHNSAANPDFLLKMGDLVKLSSSE